MPGWQAHDMLAKRNIGFRESFEKVVVNHRLRALRGLFAWLKDRHQCPFPGVAALCKKTCRANQASNVHIVSARMGYGYGFAPRVSPRDVARVGKASRFFDR